MASSAKARRVSFGPTIQVVVPDAAGVSQQPVLQVKPPPPGFPLTSSSAVAYVPPVAVPPAKPSFPAAGVTPAQPSSPAVAVTPGVPDVLAVPRTLSPRSVELRDENRLACIGGFDPAPNAIDMGERAGSGDVVAMGDLEITYNLRNDRRWWVAMTVGALRVQSTPPVALTPISAHITLFYTATDAEENRVLNAVKLMRVYLSAVVSRRGRFAPDFEFRGRLHREVSEEAYAIVDILVHSRAHAAVHNMVSRGLSVLRRTMTARAVFACNLSERRKNWVGMCVLFNIVYGLHWVFVQVCKCLFGEL